MTTAADWPMSDIAQGFCLAAALILVAGARMWWRQRP